jgi:hypothetical protein
MVPSRLNQLRSFGIDVDQTGAVEPRSGSVDQPLRSKPSTVGGDSFTSLIPPLILRTLFRCCSSQSAARSALDSESQDANADDESEERRGKRKKNFCARKQAPQHQQRQYAHAGSGKQQPSRDDLPPSIP